MKQKKPSSLTRILGYAGGHKNLTILGCVLSALSAVLGLAPYLCVWLVARSILAAWPSLDGGGDLGRFGWMAVWFAIGSILLYFAALMSTHIAAFRTARNIRRAAMTHVLKLPLGFFTGNQSGRLRKLIDDNAGLTEDLLAHKLPDLAATAVTPIAAIVVLFLFDWRMGLLCLITMVLALLSMCLMMGGKNAGFFHRYQQEIERMSGEAVEYVRGIPVVKMFQQTVYSFKAFYAAIQDYLDECANRKISLAPLVKAGKMTFQDTMVYQELLYRIQVLETCKMLCKAAPITTNMNDLLLHYQLTDTLLSCMVEERHMGFPADDKGKAQRKTAVENFHRVLTDFRKRFSSFRAEKPEQYQQAISAMVNTVLPVWIQMRNTYVPIGNGGKNG